MEEVVKGHIFTLQEKQVTQAMIDRYAKASADCNPLHTDPEFARTTRYGGTIAHGMLSIAFIQELMTRAFGQSWLESGELEASFMAPVRPGESIRTEARVLRTAPAGEDARQQVVRLQVTCLNSRGDKVILGKAGVKISIGS